MDALKRCMSVSISVGTLAVVAGPIDAHAEQCYAKYGFIKIPAAGKMFLPMKTIIQLF